MVILDLVAAYKFWLVALLILVAAIAAAFVIHAIAAAALNRIVRPRQMIFRSLIKKTNGVARFGFMLLALSLVLPIVPVNAVVVDEIHKVLIAAVVLLIGWLALAAFNVAADHYVG